MMLLQLVFAILLPPFVVGAKPPYGSVNPVKGLNLNYDYTRTCTVASRGHGKDDSEAIIEAFKECKKDSLIVFKNTTYNIGKVLKFTDLNNVKIDIKGTLRWNDDLDYWLENSLPIGPGTSQDEYPPAAYQNQTTAFILGGKHLYVEGHGYGTFNGNGQAWYDLVKGESNYPNRPHAIVITATDSYFHGLRWVQPQMWTVTIVGSKRVLLEDIFVSAKSTNSNPARNTDGANTMFSDYITFRRWEIENGDDSIAAKANSTNILIEDSIFHEGQGVAIGSIGQYNGRYEVIERVAARNITMHGSRYAARIKTWTGEVNEYPPNGGGGGLGRAKNIVFQDIRINDAANSPMVINQCYTNVGKANCSTSKFEVDDIQYLDIVGTTQSSTRARFQCSRSQGGCEDLTFDGVDITGAEGEEITDVKCSNVIDPQGFEC